MADPIVIRAEPATLQVRTAAMASAAPGDHLLVIGQDETRASVQYHGACSCGQWSASHHTDRAGMESIHATHVAKKTTPPSGEDADG